MAAYGMLGGMARPPNLFPGDLTKQELLAIVEGVVDIAWPLRGARPSRSSAIDRIKDLLDEYHLRPEDAG